MTKPRLIGLAGFKRCGKTTVAEHITASASNWEHISFAGPIRLTTNIIFGSADSSFNLERDKEKVASWAGVSPREFMQKMGTEFGRSMIHPEFWVRRAMLSANRLLDEGRAVVISDVRFANEAKAIRDAGGEVWWINRPGCKSDGHASEQGIPVHLVDHIIDNDGDIELLKCEVSDILETPFEKLFDMVLHQDDSPALVRDSYTAVAKPPVAPHTPPAPEPSKMQKPPPVEELYSARHELRWGALPTFTPAPGSPADMLEWEEPRV